MQKLIPHLWFDNQAEEAMNFYVSLFKDSQIMKAAMPDTYSTEVI